MFMSTVRMAIFCYSASGLRRTEVDRGVPKMWMMALHWLTDNTTKRDVSQPHESLFVHNTTRKITATEPG
ncbi:hypothetical protein CMEL01_00145 [Colletotrichum melonis]|uniref:Uncharacterized protein n=1 Tax=Colletotrichum melonis TaxID=1209925 RepID=A0AAI9V616_9PEZI|nr:hypothetical protein CMEL01_00145 [Colletotrichum melonis]